MNSPARGRIADSSPASAGSTEPTGAGAVPDEPDDPGYAAAYRAFAAMRNLVLGSDDRRREVADATGLSFSRSRALRRLARKPMRMTELAAEMATDKPYTTLIVDDLERRGLVVRTISPQDRRAKVVSVTDSGREMADLATHILSRPPAALREALSVEELAVLEELLSKIEIR